MRFSELDGRVVGLWGLGRETRSFVAWARERLPGARIEALATDEPVRNSPVPVVVDALASVEALRWCDVVVRSPGVSIYRPELQALMRHGVQVVTPTSLWLAERAGRRVIGVTGTKGKSTTATMIAHLIRASGLAVDLAGNIGRPALDLLDASPHRWAVIELSSYHTTDLAYGPEVAVLTNLHREHIDWHGDETTYQHDKTRLLGLPGVHACVLPASASQTLDDVAAGCARAIRFGHEHGWHVSEEGLEDSSGVRVMTTELPLRGRHNALNLCAALAALDAARIPQPRLPEAVRRINALPHRLETVHVEGGLTWVDDSISTTPESAIAALAAYPDRDVVLIGGGQDRQQDYGALGKVVAARGAVVLGLPITGQRLVAAARSAGASRRHARIVADMEAAVREARATAPAGSVVLLSPAAPSYNRYRNFEDRGDHFAQLARRGD